MLSIAPPTDVYRHPHQRSEMVVYKGLLIKLTHPSIPRCLPAMRDGTFTLSESQPVTILPCFEVSGIFTQADDQSKARYCSMVSQRTEQCSKVNSEGLGINTGIRARLTATLS